MNIIYTTASTTEELLQILSLQRMNLKSSISAEEMNQEGFVTVEHDLDLLKRMNNACPHIIAKEDEKIVAYSKLYYYGPNMYFEISQKNRPFQRVI